MTIYGILLVIDILLLIVAGGLFAVGRLAGEPLAGKLSLPIKIMLLLAFVIYIATEVVIEHAANLYWGLLLLVAMSVIFYVLNRQRNKS